MWLGILVVWARLNRGESGSEERRFKSSCGSSVTVPALFRMLNYYIIILINLVALTIFVFSFYTHVMAVSTPKMALVS